GKIDGHEMRVGVQRCCCLVSRPRLLENFAAHSRSESEMSQFAGCLADASGWYESEFTLGSVSTQTRSVSEVFTLGVGIDTNPKRQRGLRQTQTLPRVGDMTKT